MHSSCETSWFSVSAMCLWKLFSDITLACDIQKLDLHLLYKTKVDTVGGYLREDALCGGRPQGGLAI